MYMSGKLCQKNGLTRPRQKEFEAKGKCYAILHVVKAFGNNTLNAPITISCLENL